MYGPVCPVVWEGEGRETFPYPDFWLKSSIFIEVDDLLTAEAARTAMSSPTDQLSLRVDHDRYGVAFNVWAAIASTIRGHAPPCGRSCPIPAINIS